MKEGNSIYRNGDKTIVCFGKGRICVCHTEDDKGQQLVWLGDTQKDRTIGIYTKEEPDWTWDKDITGDSVLLGFDNVTSIEVLEEALKIAKENLVKNSE